MVRIGIELNGIIRNLNKQILKYYVKDINKAYDEDEANLNVFNLADHLDFGSQKKKENFLYIDYPYEVFGCARECSKDLLVRFDEWLDKIASEYGDEVEVFFFSAKENALTIQSTYFFLSKTGTRVREMRFPKDCTSVWKIADIVVTNNREIVLSKPSDKKCIVVKNDETSDFEDKAVWVVNNFDEISTNFDKTQSIINSQMSPMKTFIYKVKNIFK